MNEARRFETDFANAFMVTLGSHGRWVWGRMQRLDLPKNDIFTELDDAAQENPIGSVGDR